MHVFVQIAQTEDLVIVSNWVTSEEFFWLLEAALMLCDLIVLCLEGKTI
jgi:hypothetical protein